MAGRQFIRLLNPRRSDELLLARRVNALILGAHQIRKMALVELILKRGVWDYTLQRLYRLSLHLGRPVIGLGGGEVMEQKGNRVHKGKEAGRFLMDHSAGILRERSAKNKVSTYIQGNPWYEVIANS
jgi:hypothetical protein